MAKAQSFAEKMAKSTQDFTTHCPICGESIAIIKRITSEKSDKTGAWRFNQKFVGLCKCGDDEQRAIKRAEQAAAGKVEAETAEQPEVKQEEPKAEKAEEPKAEKEEKAEEPETEKAEAAAEEKKESKEEKTEEASE